MNENQIVVYHTDNVERIEVRFDGDTVWLLQPQIAELFKCSLENVRLHLKNIYAGKELDKLATSKESLEVRQEGNRSVTRRFTYYNLDAIISVGYRVNSIIGVRFTESFHDRFLVIDDKELYLIGASLKDLGKKCFAFTKLDPGEITRIKKAAFSSSVP